jgi:parvulin-like peptidyl-prolyl isomerase
MDQEKQNISNQFKSEIAKAAAQLEEKKQETDITSINIVSKDRQLVLDEVEKQRVLEQEKTMKKKLRSKVNIDAQAIKDNADKKILSESSSAESIKPAKKTKKPKIQIWSVVFILIIIIIAGFFSSIYWFKLHNPVINKSVQFLNLPAAYVNGRSITLSDFNSDVEALSLYYDRNKQQVSSTQLRQNALDTLIRVEVIKQLADKNSIKLSDVELNNRIYKVFQGAENQKSANDLSKELYGWNFEQYIQKILKPMLLTEKVENLVFGFTPEVFSKKQKINEIYTLLKEDPSKFSTIAQDVNEDETAKSNGDLGWFKLNQNNPLFELYLLQLNPGEISKVIETPDSLQILKLDERVNDSEGRPSFHVSHIYFKKPLFDDFIKDETKKAHVFTLVRI